MVDKQKLIKIGKNVKTLIQQHPGFTPESIIMYVHNIPESKLIRIRKVLERFANKMDKLIRILKYPEYNKFSYATRFAKYDIQHIDVIIGAKKEINKLSKEKIEEIKGYNFRLE